MEISVGEKNRVIEQYKLGNLEEAIKILIILNNKGYDETLDKHFIYQNLALFYKKIEDNKIEHQDYSFSKYYVECAYNNILKYKHEHQLQYSDVIWLQLELNKYDISNKELIGYYNELIEYYTNINDLVSVISLNVNIYEAKNDSDSIANILIDASNIDDREVQILIDAILQECKEIFGDTYYSNLVKKINNNRNNIRIA